ncbi:MAG: DUF2924 domain-containing protein [Candidatus Brocadiae bacterium]|nr:DUF2924 domain-containing protein [Candidatus Brocadiia bacterium]
MTTMTLVQAKEKLAGLSNSDVAWIYRKLTGGQKPPRGTKPETLRDAVADAFREKAEGPEDAAILPDDVAGWFGEVGEGRPATMKPKPEKEMNIAVELGKLAKLPTGSLREKYEILFGKPVKTGNRQFLLKKVAWKLQADAHGGLSEKAKARAEEIVQVGGVGTKLAKKLAEAKPRDPRLPAAGSVITKTWREKELQVLVGENDFEYEGTKWRSLSAIASKLLGCPSNGYLFFNLLPAQKEAAEKRAAKQAGQDGKAAEAAEKPSPAADSAPDAPQAELKGKQSRRAAKAGKGAK